MSTITALNITSQIDTFLTTLWTAISRSEPSDSVVTIINNNAITYDATTDKFTITHSDTLLSGVLYNLSPNPVFSLSFVLNWKMNNTSQLFRCGWGDASQKYEIELSLNTTASASTFTPLTVKFKYADKTNIYQLLSTTTSLMYTNTNHLCIVECNAESDITFSIEGVTVFKMNKTDVYYNNENLIRTSDPIFFGNFGFQYSRNSTLRSGASAQGTVELSEVNMKNFQYFGDHVLVDNTITAVTYENLESQPIISGMSNLLYNELTHQKMSLTYNNYTAERQYPPVRTFNANTYTVSGQAYGNGEYKVSSGQVPEYAWIAPFQILDGNLSTSFSLTNEFLFGSDGTYTGIPFTVPMIDSTLKEYKGFEVTVQLPVSILLTKFVTYYTNMGTATIAQHCMLGSEDGNMWTEIYTQDGLSLAQNVYNTITLPSTHTKAYKHYKYVMLKLGNTGVNRGRITELYFLGKEYTVDTFFTASNNNIECSTLRATTLYEGGVSLANKYQEKITGTRWFNIFYNPTNGSVSIGWAEDRLAAYQLDVNGYINSVLGLYEGGVALSDKYQLKNAVTTTPTASASVSGTVKLEDTYPPTSPATDATCTSRVIRAIYSLANSKISSQWSTWSTNKLYYNGLVAIGSPYPPASVLHVTGAAQIDDGYLKLQAQENSYVNGTHINILHGSDTLGTQTVAQYYHLNHDYMTINLGCKYSTGPDSGNYYYPTSLNNSYHIIKSDGLLKFNYAICNQNTSNYGYSTTFSNAITINANAGNVGICTTSPGASYKLDVDGSANATALYENGVALSSKYVSTGTLTSSQWTTTGNNIYYTTGNVGIGTTSPTSTLDVNGTITTPARIAVTNGNPGDLISKAYTTAGDRYGVGMYFGGTTRLFCSGTFSGASIRLSKATNNVTTGSATFTDLVTVLGSNGNVGINTTNPSEKLDVNGTINCTGLKVGTVSQPTMYFYTINDDLKSGWSSPQWYSTTNNFLRKDITITFANVTGLSSTLVTSKYTVNVTFNNTNPNRAPFSHSINKSTTSCTISLYLPAVSILNPADYPFTFLDGMSVDAIIIVMP